MTSPDDVRLRVLHTVRILGYAGTSHVSERAGVPAAVADEALLDAQAAGRVVWTRFEDDGGWSLTEAGRSLGERLLAEELERAGARVVVESVMTQFESLNFRVTDACTRWQLTQMGITEPSMSLAQTIKDLALPVEHGKCSKSNWCAACRGSMATTSDSAWLSIAPGGIPRG